MTFGDKWKGFMGSTTDEDILKIFKRYHELGGNFIDTANVYQYGQSEEKVSWGLQKNNIPRDDMVIATKYTNIEQGKEPNNRGNHKKAMYQAIDLSLKRLQTHYVDILYVHFWDFTTATDEIMRALDDLVRLGKVHHIAISDSPAWEVSAANTMAHFYGWSQFIGYQGKYSLVVREVENDVLPMCEKFNLGFIPWAVLGQGKLTGKYKKGEEKPKDVTRTVAFSDLDFTIQDEVIKIANELKVTPSQVAINWSLQKKIIPSVLVGTRTYEQFEDSMKALEFKLSIDQINALNKVSEPAIKRIFPHDFIGTSYQNNPWLYMGGQKYTIQ